MKLLRISIYLGIFILIISPSLSYGYDLKDTLDNIEFYSNDQIVLLTGFEPFANHEINPSQLIVESLNGQVIDEAEIIGIVLPVDFEDSLESVIQAIEQYHPDIVISLGLSAITRKINVEKISINIKRIPRNNTLWSFPRRLDPNDRFFRLSSLNTKEIVKEIKNANIPVRQSFFAGTYICNAVFYGTLGYLEENDLPTKMGFIHVPLLTSQDPKGMELETMVDAVEIAVKTSL